MIKAFLVVPLLAACAAVPADPVAVTGSWGGEHIGITATNVAASFDFDCAAGRIDAPVTIGRDGRFALNGVYFPGHGGPTRIDIPRALPAVYRGSVAGSSMQLSIEIPSQKQTVGPYVLRRDAQPQLFRCL